jgi:hypothetical protein
MSLPRKFAIMEGRAMVHVRSLKTDKGATIGVCPACWNIKLRRKVLLTKLKNMGYTVQHRADLLEGRYIKGKNHAPGCPFRGLR